MNKQEAIDKTVTSLAQSRANIQATLNHLYWDHVEQGLVEADALVMLAKAQELETLVAKLYLFSKRLKEDKKP